MLGKSGVLGAVPIIREGVQLAVTTRQAWFDSFALSEPELTLKGKNIPGGKITLQNGEYSISWVVVNQKGRGVEANLHNSAAFQQVINRLTNE